MKFSGLSVLCLLLSILLCGAYPELSDDGNADNQKLVNDQIKEIFEKATALVKEGFQKSAEQIQKSAQGSWTALGDKVKKGNEESLQAMAELIQTMKGHMDDAMKTGQDNFQKMMDKATEHSGTIKAKIQENAELMMDKAKKLFDR